mmetsp:Transcript_8224/g.20073  ORF Transcript_8224/g.20073 Transcript_8224/m.20073 type:complete len:369 (+) Transcript_8224:736-1842(+)
MVGEEVDETHVAVEGEVALQGSVELPEVLVAKRGPDGLRELVVGPRVQQPLARPHPRVVVPVDYLAEEDVLGVGLGARGAEVAPERGGELVRHVQPPPVHPHLEPELADREEVLAHILVLHVQLRQLLMPLPRAVRELIAKTRLALSQEVPILVLRRLPLLPQIHQLLEGVELAAGVVEDAVEDNPDAALVEFIEHDLEGLVVSDPPVDLEVVHRVIPVGLGLEERREVDGCHAQRVQVVVELLELLEALLRLRREIVGRRNLSEEPPTLLDAHPSRRAQRVDLVDDGVLEPLRCGGRRKVDAGLGSEDGAERDVVLVTVKSGVGRVFWSVGACPSASETERGTLSAPQASFPRERHTTRKGRGRGRD